jgi:hypothetical protein
VAKPYRSVAIVVPGGIDAIHVGQAVGIVILITGHCRLTTEEGLLGLAVADGIVGVVVVVIVGVVGFGEAVSLSVKRRAPGR